MRKVMLVLAVAAIVGCGKEVKNKNAPLFSMCERSYEELSDSDIIVKVNGKALTKGDLEREIDVQAELMRIGKPNAKVSDIDRLRARLRKAAEKRFIERRVMLDEAERRGFTVTPEDRREIRERFAKTIIPGKAMYGVLSAKLDERLRKELDAGLDLDKLNQKVNIALLEECKVKVSEFTARMKHRELEDYNKRAREEEAQIWRSASNTWNRIQAGESFVKAAERCESSSEHISSDLNWGEFDLDFFRDDAELCHFLTVMPKGSVSPPLAGDNGILIVMMLDRIPVDFSANQLKPHYRLGKIFFELPEIYPLGTVEELRVEMEKQRTEKEFRKRISRMVAQAKVEYPIGKVDMSKAKRDTGKLENVKNNESDKIEVNKEGAKK